MNSKNLDIQRDVLIHKTMEEIISFLKKNKLKLSSSLADGRMNSAKNEEEVIEILNIFNESEWMCKNKLIITSPNKKNNREWYDFAIENSENSDEEIFVPVNIKVSGLTGADNLNCKLGIFYTLTGIIPKNQEINNGCRWDKYLKKLSENMKDVKNTNTDYYFLIINKNDTNDIFYTTLKSIKTLIPNGNNLPFQCKWSDNRDRANRSYENAKQFILKNFKKSVKSIEIPAAFEKYIEGHITKDKENKNKKNQDKENENEDGVN